MQIWGTWTTIATSGFPIKLHRSTESKKVTAGHKGPFADCRLKFLIVGCIWARRCGHNRRPLRREPPVSTDRAACRPSRSIHWKSGNAPPPPRLRLALSCIDAQSFGLEHSLSLFFQWISSDWSEHHGRVPFVGDVEVGGSSPLFTANYIHNLLVFSCLTWEQPDWVAPFFLFPYHWMFILLPTESFRSSPHQR